MIILSIKQSNNFYLNTYEISACCQQCSDFRIWTVTSKKDNILSEELADIITSNVCCFRCGKSFNSTSLKSISFENFYFNLQCSVKHSGLLQVTIQESKYYIPLKEDGIILEECPSDILKKMQKDREFENYVKAFIEFCNKCSFINLFSTYKAEDNVESSVKPIDEIIKNLYGSKSIIPVSELVSIPMKLRVKNEDGSYSKISKSLIEIRFNRLGRYDNPTAKKIIELLMNYFQSPSKESCMLLCFLLKIEYTESIYELFNKQARQLSSQAQINVTENRHQALFARLLLRNLYLHSPHDTQEIPTETKSYNNTKYFFSEDYNVKYDSYKRYARVFPIKKDNKLQYKISWLCKKCNTEQVKFLDFDISEIPNLLHFIKYIEKCRCEECNKKTFLDKIQGIMFYVDIDTIIRYRFKYAVNDVIRFHITYKGYSGYYAKDKLSLVVKECLYNNPQLAEALPLWCEQFNQIEKYLIEAIQTSFDKFPSIDSSKDILNKDVIVEQTKGTAAKLNQIYISDCKHSGCSNTLWAVNLIEHDIITLRCLNCREEMTVMDEYLQKHFILYTDRKIVTYPIINKADVIVLSGVRRCTNRGHHIEDIAARITLKSDGNTFVNIVPVSHCQECQRYTMLSSDYKNLNGKPVCVVKDLSGKTISNPSDEFLFESSEHIMHKYGYNVRFGNGLSAFDRQQILVKLIRNKILTRSQICEHLEYCIRRNGSRSNMENAIDKWKADLKFVLNYKPSQNSNVDIQSITIK